MAFGGYLQANTAVDLIVGPFVDETNGKDAETGLTITQADVRLSKNGGNIAQKNEATALAHDELGNYMCKLDTTDTNTEGILTLAVHESGALPIKMDYMVLAQAAYISHVTAKDSGYMDVDVKLIEAADPSDTINAACDASIETYDLDHLISAACDTGPAIADHVVDNSILAFMLDDAGDISGYDDAKHSQVAIGDDADLILADTGTTLENRLIAIEGDTDVIDDGTSGLVKIAQDVAAILTDTGTTIPGTITTAQNDLDTITGASGVLIDTNAVDADALKADAVTEIWAAAMTDLGAGAPSATASALVALNYLYEAWRNKTIVNGTNDEIELYKDDGSTKLCEADISDDGTDFTKGEYGAVD